MEKIIKILKSEEAENKIKILQTLDNTNNLKILQQIILRLNDDSIQVRGDELISFIKSK